MKALTGRRGLTWVVLGCAVGALLALFAATQTWQVEISVRPEPLAPVRTPVPGGQVVPWLPPLGVVALAGAGALIATRAVSRRVVAILLLIAGLAVAGSGGYGVSLVAGWRLAWPLVCVVGGLAVCAAGVLALVLGRQWPSMSARYDRRPAAPEPAAATAGSSGLALWDALDRGEDPTA